MYFPSEKQPQSHSNSDIDFMDCMSLANSFDVWLYFF